MDIKALPAGTHCLIDANIFIYHLADASHESSEFIARIRRYEIEGFVTTTIVAEVLHCRMMAEALAKSLITPGQPLKKLKASPHVITRLVDYGVEVEKLLELPLTVIETTAADILASDELRRAYGLFVNDPVNLACAHRNGLSDIVSHDDDFRRVPNIRLWEPTDI